MRSITQVISSLCFIVGLMAGSAQAHFVWLVVEDGMPGKASVHFSEAAKAGDPSLLAQVQVDELRQARPQGPVVRIPLSRGEGELMAQPRDTRSASAFHLDVTWGTLTRGDSTFLLRYWAKALVGQPSHWNRLDTSATQEFDIRVVSSPSTHERVFEVVWRGTPVADCEYAVLKPSREKLEGKTDAAGRFTLALEDFGQYALRARYVDAVAGEFDGKVYGDVRHYSTLTFDHRVEPAQTTSTTARAESSPYPSLPQKVTSFGAATADGWLYVYGGHTGEPHSYYREAQSNAFRRIRLDQPDFWEELPRGPRLQGLALVAHDGVVYRLGGFSAMNETDEPANLHSQSSFARFDPAVGDWEELPPMPLPRSSFDAAVLGDHLYVVGGWNMAGPDSKEWLNSAFVMDLSRDRLAWQEVPSTPFHRRALSVAAFAGELYACGGMQREGGTTTAVAIYNPETRAWREGPSLAENGRMAGFGSASFAVADRLYVTAYDGALQRLSRDGRRWERLSGLGASRFFHRMLPRDERSLVVVAGADMRRGSYDDLVVLDVENAVPLAAQ